jgi:hypothetical protein
MIIQTLITKRNVYCNDDQASTLKQVARRHAKEYRRRMNRQKPVDLLNVLIILGCLTACTSLYLALSS